MSRVLRSAAAATAFLTRVPLARFVRIEAEDIAYGAWCFPVVGGVIGGTCGLLADIVASWLPPLAAGVLAVGAAALLTGAMHLDALADSADALAGTTRERALEIMRDHAVGAYGATALIVVLVFDAALFGALAQSGDAAIAGLAAGAAGRTAMLLPAFALPYARAQAGQGRILESMGASSVLLAVVVAGLISLPARVAGLAGLGAAAAVAAVLTLFALRRFAGITGDLLGATAKLAETAALAFAAALLT